MKLHTLAFLSISGLTVLGIACGGKTPPKEPAVVEAVADAAPPEPADAAPAEPKPLIERIGGKDTLKGVLDTFGKNVAGDKRVSKAFGKTLKVEQFRDMLFDHICEKSGGDCKYAGKPWKDVTKPLKITEVQWDALVEALKSAMEEKKVGETEAGDVISTIGELKDQIVDPASKKK